MEDRETINNPNKYLGVNVTKYTFSAASEDQGLGYLEEVGLTSEPQEIDITYSEYPAIVSTIQVFVDTTSSAQILNKKIYSDHCIITLTGTDGDTTFVTITGKPYNKATTAVTKGSTAKNIKQIINNYLITGEIANDVADYQYERVVNKYTHMIEVVKEADFDLGDRIEISTDIETATEGQYITNISFSISYTTNTLEIEALDE